MAHFNEGKDTSDWEKPQTVNQFGEGLKAVYQPNDVKTQSKLTISKLNNDINPSLAIGVNDEAVKQFQLPEGYQSGKWITDLSDEDKQVYAKYEEWKQSGSETYQFDYPDNIYH
jgi:hypothetical protein